MDNTKDTTTKVVSPFDPNERLDQLNNHTPSTQTFLKQASASVGLGAVSGFGIASYRDFSNVKLRLSSLSSKSSSAMKEVIDNHPSLLQCISTNASEFLTKLYEAAPEFVRYNIKDYINLFNELIKSVGKVRSDNIFVSVIKSFIGVVLYAMKFILKLVEPVFNWVTNIINAPFPGTDIINGVPKWSYGKMFVLVAISAGVVWALDKVKKIFLDDKNKTKEEVKEDTYFMLKSLKEAYLELDTNYKILTESEDPEESIGIPKNINIMGDFINNVKFKAKNMVINLTNGVKTVAEKNTSKIIIIMLGILTCGFVLNWLSVKPTLIVKETIGKRVFDYLRTSAIDVTRGVGKDPLSMIDPKLLKGLSGGVAAGAVAGAIVDKPLEGSAVGAAGGLVMTAMGLVA